MESGKMDAIDMVVTVLQEHEKALDMIVEKLEKIVAKINKNPAVPKEYVVKVNPEESDFTDKVAGSLLNLPKGFNFEIPKVVHTAYVKISKVEENSCSKAEEEKSWEKVLKDEE